MPPHERAREKTRGVTRLGAVANTTASLRQVHRAQAAILKGRAARAELPPLLGLGCPRGQEDLRGHPTTTPTLARALIWVWLTSTQSDQFPPCFSCGTTLT